MSLVDVTMLQTTPTCPHAYCFLLNCSYTVTKDFETKGYFTDKAVGPSLWPKLLAQYSDTDHVKPLNIVKGVFPSSSAGASSSHSEASSSSAGPSKPNRQLLLANSSMGRRNNVKDLFQSSLIRISLLGIDSDR